MCFSCICLFVLYMLVFLPFFSSSWCRGLVVVCDCGTPWTFLLPFFFLMMWLISFQSQLDFDQKSVFQTHLLEDIYL